MFLIVPNKTRQEQVVGADADKGWKQIEFTSLSEKEKLLLFNEKKIFSRDMPVMWPFPAIEETRR